MSDIAINSRKMPRWRRVALPLSIALNLFLVALIGGHMWRQHRLTLVATSPVARILARAEASLPPKQAAAFADVIRRDSSGFGETQGQVAAARRTLARAVTADQFDRQQVRQAFLAWRTAWDRFFDQFSGTLVDALAQMPAEDRREFVAQRPVIHLSARRR